MLDRDPAYPAVAYRSPIAGTRAVQQSVCSELLTQLTFPSAPAWYVFSCTLDPRVRVAFVWVDDHLICSAGPYAPPANSTDGSQANPIYQRPGSARRTAMR